MKKILLILIMCLTLVGCATLKKKNKVRETTTKIEQREIREIIDTQIVIPEISIEDTFMFHNDTIINLVKDNVKVNVKYTKKDNKIVLNIKKDKEVIPIKMDRTIKETIKTDSKVVKSETKKKSINFIPFIILLVAGIIGFIIYKKLRSNYV